VWTRRARARTSSVQRRSSGVIRSARSAAQAAAFAKCNGEVRGAGASQRRQKDRHKKAEEALAKCLGPVPNVSGESLEAWMLCHKRDLMFLII